MSKVRTIRKYPNRRLYDTEESRYITLSDIRRLVMDDVPFVVIDKKSGDDITRAILLQVISDEESNGEPILTQDFLSEMIRAYRASMPSFVGNYLEQSLMMFLRQQQELQSQMSSLMGVDPMSTMREAAAQNWNRWVGMQQDVWRAWMGAARHHAEPETTSREPADGEPKPGD